MRSFPLVHSCVVHTTRPAAAGGLYVDHRSSRYDHRRSTSLPVVAPQEILITPLNCTLLLVITGHACPAGGAPSALSTQGSMKDRRQTQTLQNFPYSYTRFRRTPTADKVPADQSWS